MKLFVCLSTIWVILSRCHTLSSGSTSTRNCTYEDLRQCFKLAESQSRWPIDVSVVEVMCSQLSADGDCWAAFNDRCNQANLASRQWLDDLRGDLAIHNDRVCRSEETRTTFLTRMACFRKPRVLMEMLASHRRFVAMIERVPRYQASQRKRAICCAQIYFRDRGREAVGKFCDKNLGEYLEVLMGILYSNYFEYTCTNVESYQQCISSLSGNIGSELNSIATNPKTPTTKHLFALPTFFRLWAAENTEN